MERTVGISDELRRRTSNRFMLGWLGSSPVLSGERRLSLNSVMLLLLMLLLIITSQVNSRSLPLTTPPTDHQTVSYRLTRSHPEMVGDMSRVTLNFDLSKIPFVHF